MRFTAVLAVLLVCVGLCSAATYNLSPANTTWADTLSGLTAGDTAILAAGEYLINGTFALNLAGRSGSPITIKGTVVDGTQQTIIKQEGTSNNVLNVAGTYFGLYNMTLTCAGTCLRGISMVGATSHATFEDLIVHHTNRTAFGATASGVDYNALTVRRVEVYDTGLDTSECFLFGCANDQCRIHDSTIELNYCHDISDTMTNYGAGIQVNTGSYKNIIRNNVVSKANSAGIRVFDDYGKGVNLIEGNAVTQTRGNGIQVSSGAIVRNNIVTDVTTYGIAVSNSQLKTSNRYHDIQIVHNTVIRSGTADLMLPALSGDDFVVVNNAFLSSNSFSVGQQTSTVVWRKNAYVGGSVPSGVSESSLILVNASSVVGDKYYPTNTSALINAGTGSYATPVTWDYNGTPRSATTPTIGAYEYTTATNPGQDVGTTIKNPLPTYPSDSYNADPDTDNGGENGGNGDDSAASLAQSWISLILA